MSVSLTVTGVAYDFPQRGDRNWGTAVTNWATAVTSGMLQKSGGTFTLTADVNFGATYGLISSYFTSRTANAASAGALRLARADSIKWRNQANGADLALGPNASDVLQYGGISLVDLSSTQTLTNKTLTAPTISDPTITGTTTLVDVSTTGGTTIGDTAGDALTVNATSSFDGPTTFTGNVTVGNASSDTVTWTARQIGSFVPDLTDQYDFGTTLIRWRSLFLSANADVAGTLTVTGATTLATSLTGLVKASSGVLSAATLVNADVSASAAIDFSKLATLTSANILVGSAGNVATSVAVTGDVTISNAGVTTIGASKVTNGMLAGSIAYSKLSLTGAILNADLAGSIAYSKLSLTGAILNADLAGSIAYSKLTLTGSIVNADVSASAGIVITKLGNGTANQLIGANSGATANEFKSLATGTSGTDFAIAHSANTITFNIPDAGTSNRGLVTTGSQTFAGAKTFAGLAVTSSNGGIPISATVSLNNDLGIRLTNSSDTASAYAYFQASVAGDTAQDAYYIAKLAAGAGTVWAWGLDNSDSDAWVLSANGILGTSNAIKVTTGLAVMLPGISTTASAANAFIDNAASNSILRSTSSLRYKEDVSDLSDLASSEIYNLRPVTFTDKTFKTRHIGLIAEEVALIDPMLVHFTKERVLNPNSATPEKLVPDGVQYDRIGVLIVKELQKHEARLKKLEKEKEK